MIVRELITVLSTKADVSGMAPVEASIKRVNKAVTDGTRKIKVGVKSATDSARVAPEVLEKLATDWQKFKNKQIAASEKAAAKEALIAEKVTKKLELEAEKQQSIAMKHAENIKGMFGKILVGGIAAGLFGAMVSKSTEEVLQLNRAATELGVSFQGMQDLDYMSKATGGSFKMMTQGIYMMNKALGSAELRPNGPVNQALSRMHLNLKDLLKDKPDAQFIKIAEGIADISDPALRAQTAMTNFGRGARELLPIVNSGKDGIKNLMSEFHRFGQLSDRNAADITRFGKAQRTFMLGISQVGKLITASLAPLLEMITKGLVKVIEIITKTPEPLRDLVVVLGAMAAIIPIVAMAVSALGGVIAAVNGEFIAGMMVIAPWMVALGA